VNDPKITIFAVRFSDDSRAIPYRSVYENPVDACAQVRLWNKDRPVEVTSWDLVGLGTINKGTWTGTQFYGMHHKELEYREAQARADARATQAV
jgi:hypothetical protein